MTTLLDDAPVPCLVSTLDLGFRACDSLVLPKNTSPPSRTARQVGGRGKQRARRRACSGGVRGKEGERERERERENETTSAAGPSSWPPPSARLSAPSLVEAAQGFKPIAPVPFQHAVGVRYVQHTAHLVSGPFRRRPAEHGVFYICSYFGPRPS